MSCELMTQECNVRPWVMEAASLRQSYTFGGTYFKQCQCIFADKQDIMTAGYHGGMYILTSFAFTKLQK